LILAEKCEAESSAWKLKPKRVKVDVRYSF